MSDGIVQAPEFIITQGNAFVGENASSSNNNIETRRFTVKYAGLVPEISSDIDPSGRTDLLKILDDAEIHGHICCVNSTQVVEDAILEVSYDAVIVRSSSGDEKCQNDDLLLVVPLHMLASIGFVREEELNILPMKIGEVDGNSDVYDLAVIYTKTANVAEQIYNYLAACFQFVYRESLSSMDQEGDSGRFVMVQSSSSSTASHLTESNYEGRQQPCPTVSTSTSGSSKNTIELINDYITMLSACLTHEELNKFAVFMRRWRAKEMPILEFAQKLMELYGVERKHLLARMNNLLRGVSRDDINALNNFLQANGITENAAAGTNGSPLWTAEMSLTTEDGNSPVLDNISGCSGVWSTSGSRRGVTQHSPQSQSLRKHEPIK